MKPLVIFTGGGTAGHVMGNLSIIHTLTKQPVKIVYIGSKTGIEKELVLKQAITYYAISTGKWRRYFSFKNLTDGLLVLKGMVQSIKILRRLRPKVVFSKGGFVSFPVVLAAWWLKIPIIIHEADLNFGLANRLVLRLADKICVSFSETLPDGAKYSDKKLVTGLPLREGLFKGSKERAIQFFKLTEQMPVLLIMGGSLGAKQLNEVVNELLSKLVKKYQVIHLHGKNFTPIFQDHRYHPYVFLNQEMFDALAIADLVVSRAGANSIAELLALKKVTLLVPLIKGSRGDQLLNARKVAAQGYGLLLEALSSKNLNLALEELERHRTVFQQRLKNYRFLPANETIVNLLVSYF